MQTYGSSTEVILQQFTHREKSLNLYNAASVSHISSSFRRVAKSKKKITETQTDGEI